MRTKKASAGARQRPVPEAIRALSPMHADYVDLFTAPTPSAQDVSAEQWARAAMEGAPAAGRFLAWRVVCQLRLAHTQSADHVAGWKVAARADSWIRVEASSPFMTANIVFTTDSSEVFFATFIRYDRRMGALIWTPASAVHRAVAPGFLAGAVRRVERSRC